MKEIDNIGINELYNKGKDLSNTQRYMKLLNFVEEFVYPFNIEN